MCFDGQGKVQVERCLGQPSALPGMGHTTSPSAYPLDGLLPPVWEDIGTQELHLYLEEILSLSASAYRACRAWAATIASLTSCTASILFASQESVVNPFEPRAGISRLHVVMGWWYAGHGWERSCQAARLRLIRCAELESRAYFPEENLCDMLILVTDNNFAQSMMGKDVDIETSGFLGIGSYSSLNEAYRFCQVIHKGQKSSVSQAC